MALGSGMRKRCMVLAGVAVLTAGAVACSSSQEATTPGGSTASRTTVLLDWFPNPDHIALYLGQKDGDFAAQGLNVTFQAPSNATDALKLVSLGQVPLAISYEPETITAVSQSLDIAAVAALIPTPLNSLIISGKSGISSPSQLAGKTVGTDGDPVSAAIFKVVLSKYHLSVARTKLVSVNEGLVPAMVSGKVSAIISGYRNVEGIQLAYLGVKPHVYPVNTQGVPNYDELVVIANKHKLASDPAYRAMVRKFLVGLTKAITDAEKNPAADLVALSPVAKGYSHAVLKKMVYATAPLLDNLLGPGFMSVNAWQSFANWMKKKGLISKAVDASAVVNTSLLPKS